MDRSTRIVVSVLAVAASLGVGGYVGDLTDMTDALTGAVVAAITVVPPVLALIWGRGNRIVPLAILMVVLALGLVVFSVLRKIHPR